MNRRTALVAAASAGLVMLPTAALAYEAPGYDATVSDTSPEEGDPITVQIAGATPFTDVTLTITSDPASLPNDAIEIAGTKSAVKQADAAGVASFSVTFNAGGSYELVAYDTSGAVISTQVLAVASDAGTAAPTAGGDGLAQTGFEAAELAAGAAGLVAAGAAAVMVARRRQAAPASR